MLMFLIAIGRFSVSLGAIIVVFIVAAAGWSYGTILYFTTLGSGIFDSVSSSQLIGGIIGLLVGVVLAGSMFGLAAAIFDIQRTLKTMLSGQSPVDSGRQGYAASSSIAVRMEPRA